MIRQLQRMLARAVALAAVLLGGALAFVLAALTLATGLLIGLFVTVAAWFGARSSRRGPGAPAAGPPSGRDDTVIDVDMREIESGDGSGERAGRPEAAARDPNRPQP